MAFADGTADFRSDTVTRPTDEMRRAMAAAEVGDDAYGEDPTVNDLQDRVAAFLGMEAGLFVPSGTMANQLAIALWTKRGDDVVCPRHAHIRNAEAGAASAWSGVGLREWGDDRGVMTAGDVEQALAEAGGQAPPLGLVSFENTHYYSGGTVLAAESMAEAAAVARASGVPTYLDGARLWNAMAATALPGETWTTLVHSAMVSFSKGLGAPAGSVLAGAADWVEDARRLRKRMGGTMRQAGVLAAAAVIGLEQRERLREDHRLAAELAAGLNERLPGAVDLTTVETNMVMVDETAVPGRPGALIDALRAEGVLAGYVGPAKIRFCTHRDVDGADVARVLRVAAAVGAGSAA